MRTAKEIVDLYEERKSKLSPWAKTARMIKDVYNSDFVVPLPELGRDEMPAVANLTYQGIEQFSSRMASTMPVPSWPALRPGIKRSEELARNRGLVNLAWWDENALQLKMQKRSRHLVAYSASPVVIRPDFLRKNKRSMRYQYVDGYPCWNVRDPLCAFPAEMQAGEVHPDDCIFAYKRKLGWLRRRYPEAYPLLDKRQNATDEDSFELLEYCDEDEYVLVAVSDQHSSFEVVSVQPKGKYVELERMANRIGRCWAVVPSRITLDRPKGQFDGVVGIYFTQAMLMALNVIGMKRAVFPEIWLEPTVPGETGSIVGEPADPLKGTIGVLSGGRLNVLRTDPSVLTGNIEDRLERAFRVEASIPAEMGGESTSNVRTGRRGDAIMSAAVDFLLQGSQQIFEQSLEIENELAVAIDKEYFPKSKSVWISATKGQISYTPSELWETDVNFVKYSHAGTDVNSLVVSGLQRVGSGVMSKRTFTEIDPMIEDAESEHDRIQYEALEMAMLTSLQTRASEDPAFAPVVAEIAMKIITDKISVFEAYKTVDQTLKEQQAGMAPVGPEQAQPGAAQPQPAVAPQQPSAENLASILTSLKAGSRAVA